MSESHEGQEEISKEGGSMLNEQPTEGEQIATNEGEWLYSDNLKGTGDRPEWFKNEKYKTVQAQAEAYTALESRLGSFTGAPEEYALNVPEGLEGEFQNDDPLLVEARTMFKDMGVNQEGFDKIMGLYLGGTTTDPAQAEANRAAEVQEVLGNDHAQRISQVSGALSNLLGAEKYSEVMQHVTSPGTVLALEAVILASAPKVAPINDLGNVEGVTKAKHNEMIGAKTDDGKIRYNVDSNYRSQCDAYAEQLYNEKI